MVELETGVGREGVGVVQDMRNGVIPVGRYQEFGPARRRVVRHVPGADGDRVQPRLQIEEGVADGAAAEIIRRRFVVVVQDDGVARVLVDDGLQVVADAVARHVDAQVVAQFDE